MPNIEIDDAFDFGPDASFAEDAIDALGPDYRHRIVRQMADAGYGEAGDEDGDDLNDWLPAAANATRARPDPRR